MENKVETDDPFDYPSVLGLQAILPRWEAQSSDSICLGLSWAKAGEGERVRREETVLQETEDVSITPVS